MNINTACVTVHSLGSAENQRLGTAPGHWYFPTAREFSQPVSAKSVFRQPGFPWNYLIGSRYHLTRTLCGRGCGWACACDCHSKISLSCISKSSLTASYFRLIVSNLLSLHVQLPQTKVAFSAPNYCDTLPSERQKQIVSRNAAAYGTVLCKFHLVLAPKLRNDTSTEQNMDLSIIVIWVLFLSMFWEFLSVIFQYC